MSDNDNNSIPATTPTTPTTTTPATTTPPATTRIQRIGRVERWLRKGYGFIIDLGCVHNDGKTYGWTQDSISGSKHFVYHNALNSDSAQVFHRLFAHEYVEYTIDTSLPMRDSRLQAFNVSGLAGSLLLCDLNNAEEGNEQSDISQPVAQQIAQVPQQQVAQVAQVPPQQRLRGNNNNRNRQPPFQRHQTSRPNNQQPSSQPIFVYLPAGAPIPGFPFPPQPAAQEPNYVWPTSGIPVPK